MHELSMTAQIVESVGKALEGRAVVRLVSVRLEIGELTMLGKEQMKFAWEILTGNGPLKGSRLVMVRKPAVIECLKCGHRGDARRPSGVASHLMVPHIACPRCGGEVRVVGGRECIIRSLKAVTEDGSTTRKRKVFEGQDAQKARRRTSASAKRAGGKGTRAKGTRPPAPGTRATKGRRI